MRISIRATRLKPEPYNLSSTRNTQKQKVLPNLVRGEADSLDTREAIRRPIPNTERGILKRVTTAMMMMMMMMILLIIVLLLPKS
jgi:hypothetical protein